jgi:cobalamin biosynthesis Co2+ chelatase CbiK
VRNLKGDLGETLINSVQLDPQSYKVIVDSIKKVEIYSNNFFVRTFRKYTNDRKTLKTVKSVLKQNKLTRLQHKLVIDLVKNEMSLNRRIERLVLMQNLFKYWHVAHLPFALVMLVIMVIHVAVTLTFGYRWIF